MRFITTLAAVLLAVPPVAAQGVAGRWSSLVSHGESAPLWTEVNLWRDADGRWTGTEAFTDMTASSQVCEGRLEWRGAANGDETFAAAGCGGGTVAVSVMGGQRLVYRREAGAGPVGDRRGTLTLRGAAQRAQAVPAPRSRERPNASAAPIRVGQTVRGRLGSVSAALADGSPYADHVLTVASAQRLRITMRSAQFDTYLGVSAGGAALVTDDDGAGGTDSRVEIDVPAGATVLIRANALSRGMEGVYTLHVERI